MVNAPIKEVLKEDSVASHFDGVIDLDIEKVAKGEEVGDIKSSKGGAAMKKITKDICERLLD